MLRPYTRRRVMQREGGLGTDRSRRRLDGSTERPSTGGAGSGAVLRLQQVAGNAAVTRLLARQQTPIVTSGEQAWKDWSYFRYNSPKRALEMAPGLVENMTSAEAIQYGAEFVSWLEQEGQFDLAARSLEKMEATWSSHYAADPAKGADATLPANLTSSVLVDTGRRLADDGRHTEARQVLTRAFLLVQMQLEAASNAREREIENAGDEVHVELRRPVAYTAVKQLYDRLREIFAIYPLLTRRLRAAGRTADAARAASEGQSLRQELHGQFTLSPSEGIDELSGSAMIAEFTKVSTPRGPALRLHGANFEETDVTQLPGLPNPAEIHGRLVHSTLEDLDAALAGQVDLVEDLLDRPEVAKLFPDGDIDLRQRDQRLKVWKAVFPVLQRELGDEVQALAALMGLMQRYLKAFTVHTDYNIRDFGTSYLDSELPEDLAERAERDCGVYAVNVAYEVFLTARSGGPALDFSLVSVPGHVMLAIQMRGKDAVFVVNNDQIDGPLKGTIEDLAARFIAPIFKQRFLVSPAMSLPIGSTDMTTPAFKSAVWERFLDSSAWGLNIAPGPPGETQNALRDRTEAAYDEFYGGLAKFDQACGSLEAGLNAASGLPSERELADAVDKLRPVYLRAQSLLLLLLNTRWAGEEARRPGVEARLSPHSKILIAQPTADPPHPLVRVAMALLRLQSLGGTLTADDRALVSFMSAFSPFDVQVAAFVKAGTPAKF